ncbi:SRPBCC family protein [Flavitalea sp.]|nr:SRPBCC domain-containing protein [Flavitalea sp.]
MSTQNLIAEAERTIEVSIDTVWKALIDPALIKDYMFGTTVISDWTKGSSITWKGEMKGKKYEDKGEILEVIPEKELKYSHFSPLSGQPDKPENYHTVDITLKAEKDQTVIKLTQDKNGSEKSKKEAEQNWNLMLDSLKKLLEK